MASRVRKTVKRSIRSIPKMHYRTSGVNESFWIENYRPPSFPALKKDISVDVAIIGAGMAGLSAAYFLSKEGKKVAVFDDGLIGSGESGRTTAHITYALDARYAEIKSLHGIDNAHLVADSHLAAINAMANIVHDEKIDCNFERVDGYLFMSEEGSERELKEEADILHKIGMIGTEFRKGSMTRPFDTGSCVVFPMQAQFHPLKYMAGLARAIVRHGGKIYTRTHVEVEDAKLITEKGKKIKAKNFIVATNTPIHTTVKMHTKQAPYRTYVIASMVPKNSVTKALYWDTGHSAKGVSSPYHYIRIHPIDPRHDLLIVGGEDHKTGQDNADVRFDALERWTRKRFPQVKKVDYRWSGQVMNPVGELAFIGRIADGNYIITGHSGNGMTYCTIAGMMLSDMIAGRRSEWEGIYDPQSKPLRAAKEYIEENVNVAKEYADWFGKADAAGLDDIRKGEGAVIKIGNEPIAVYKDEKEDIHAFSAICPHLRCILKWNSTEKSFDCPCHGSRFTSLGKVINGPANRDLAQASIRGMMTGGHKGKATSEG